MQPRVSGAVPVCYVKNLELSRDFYAHFGYAEVRHGGDGDGRWSYVQSGDQTLLLACVQPPLIQVELPLLIYLYVDDLAAVGERVRAAGLPWELVGYPDHAPGGEARTTDPDGNVVLAGQRVAVAPGDRAEPTGSAAEFSLIQRAAAAVRRRGNAPAACQIGSTDGSPCPEAAEVKLADPWGDTVWGCLAHSEEALMHARAAFIATEDGYGLGPWLRARQGRTPPG
ncbi:VOC family protein [Nucisporomicrobium flavum]|uniref:VOC family protein n=1 Tax=Nucisporomicrobium flavum TaxID=2785915 RepID=UPI003C2B9794